MNQSTTIHPHGDSMSFELHPMPEFHTTAFKVVFARRDAVTIFLNMSKEETIAHLEELVANLKVEDAEDAE